MNVRLTLTVAACALVLLRPCFAATTESKGDGSRASDVNRTLVRADTTGGREAAGAFNAAIDAVAAAGGGIVAVPAGTYLVSGVAGQRIMLKSKVTLEFSPGCTIVTGAHTATSTVIEISTSNQPVIEDASIHGNGLVVIGNRSQSFTQYGLTVNVQSAGHALRRLVVRDMLIKDCRTDGYQIGGNISAPQPEDLTFENVTTENNYRNGASVIHAKRLNLINCRGRNTNGTAPQAGIDLEPDAGLAVEDVTFLGGRFDGNTGHGIYAQAGLGTTARITFIGVVAQDNGGSGLAAHRVADVLVSGCTANKNGQQGIVVGNCGQVTISGCKTAGNAKNGIQAVGNDGCALTGVVSSGNIENGFSLSTAAGVASVTTATGCVAYGNNGRGFNLSYGSDIMVSGCVAVLSGQEGIQLYQSQGCSVFNNMVCENSQAANLGADNIVLEANSNNNNVSGNTCRQSRRYFSGMAVSGAIASVVLPATRYTAGDGYYNGMTLRITGGTGAGQSRAITHYMAATGVVTLASSWTIRPDASSAVEISSAVRPRYGIRVNAGCVNNTVVANDVMNEGGGAGGVSDFGTNTRLGLSGAPFPMKQSAIRTLEEYLWEGEELMIHSSSGSGLVTRQPRWK